ncbi:rhodanese-like domain-containing protein [Nitratifractor sp.]|uniref:rhodanese-like domain-containing protein n=1 Tax=Nitratifractor sp. TaxID=2268144 RepID=UPI0025CBFC27|nr:rhodanese-like domain-containing protein [Nitratifractor sp.]
MQKTLILFVVLTWTIQAGFQSIDAKTLQKMQARGVPVIDIRTPAEWQQRGIIKGAHLLMFFDERGRPHVREWLEKFTQIVKDKKSPFILYCAHANRSKAVGQWLSEKLGYEKVYELKGGIEYGWRELNMPVKRLNKE